MICNESKWTICASDEFGLLQMGPELEEAKVKKEVDTRWCDRKNNEAQRGWGVPSIGERTSASEDVEPLGGGL